MATEAGKKSIATIKQIVTNWFNSYAKDGPGNEYLVDDFDEEINRHVGGIVPRLVHEGHITQADAADMYGWCVGKSEELREILKDSPKDLPI